MSKEKKLYSLKKACEQCPFRKDQKYLSAEAVQDIANANIFYCHKHINEDDRREENKDGSLNTDLSKEHRRSCAGHMIFRIKQEHPTQAMRVAMRFGWLNTKQFQGQDEIYDTLAIMQAEHGLEE